MERRIVVRRKKHSPSRKIKNIYRLDCIAASDITPDVLHAYWNAVPYNHSKQSEVHKDDEYWNQSYNFAYANRKEVVMKIGQALGSRSDVYLVWPIQKGKPKISFGPFQYKEFISNER